MKRVLAWTLGLLVLGSGAIAQENPRERGREVPGNLQPAEPGADAARGRPGGHPLPEGQADVENRQGTQEGLPPGMAEEQPGVRSENRTRTIPEWQLIRPRWRLGVHAYNTRTGVVITQVVPGSGASQAGLEPGDRIVTVNGFQVGIVGNQLYYLGEELQRQAGSRGLVTLLVENVRNSQLLNVDVQLTSYGDQAVRNRFPYERFVEPQPVEPQRDSGNRSR